MIDINEKYILNLIEKTDEIHKLIIEKFDFISASIFLIKNKKINDITFKKYMFFCINIKEYCLLFKQAYYDWYYKNIDLGVYEAFIFSNIAYSIKDCIMSFYSAIRDFGILDKEKYNNINIIFEDIPLIKLRNKVVHSTDVKKNNKEKEYYVFRNIFDKNQQRNMPKFIYKILDEPILIDSTMPIIFTINDFKNTVEKFIKILEEMKIHINNIKFE